MRRPAGAALLRVTLAAAAAFATASCDASGGTTAAIAETAAFEVTPRDLRVTIVEKGTLKTANQVLVRPKIPGQAKIVTLVDEGTMVQAGDVVCELDTTEVLRDVQDLDNKVIALRGEVTAAEAELSIQLSENASAVRDAELKHRFAEVELDRWRNGTDVDERTRREVRVSVSESELDRAKRRFEQMPDLLKEGFVTKEQVEEERISVLKAESEVRLARLDLENYVKYTAPKDLEQREADVRNAAQEVEREKQRATARESQRRSALDRQRSELANTQARLDERKTTLANMTIRAPAPGLVLYGDSRNPWEDRQIKVGETVYSGQPFLTLPDLSEMLVVVAVHEADVARVKAGQRAFITVETAREASIEGKVLRVAPVASQANSRWSDGVKRFNVDVALEGDLKELKLKPGLSGKVEILVDELKGVLAVPQQAVFSQSGRFHVFRLAGGATSRVPVTIEAGNAQYVVVTTGVAAGDRVLLFDPEAGGGAAVSGDAAAGAPAEGGGRSGGRQGGEKPSGEKPAGDKAPAAPTDGGKPSNGGETPRRDGGRQGGRGRNG